jgi:serine/threonine protein kinase
MGMRSTPLPEQIGRFKVEALLGRGGMGEVYKAFDPTLQRTVAVKTVRPDIDRPEYLDRLMREAQACARLSHPNIVTVYEAGQIEGVVFIAMEYLQGENLSQVLERNDLSFEGKIRILEQVLGALHHAHLFDVVHRDVKPSNIHIQSDGAVKLVDFGLARMLTADSLTASGNVLGTPHYASPEQLKGEEIDRRTDVYSTGVMAYEMLSGRRPFEPDNSSISSVILKVIQEAPKPMDTDMSRMLPEIEDIVSRAMAKMPADRYQSAEEMRGALVDFLQQSRSKITLIESHVRSTVVVTPRTIPAMPLSDADAGDAGSKRLWWIGGAAAAALIAAVMIGWPATNVESATPSSSAAPMSATPAAAVTTPPVNPPAPAPAASAPAAGAPTSTERRGEPSAPPAAVPAPVLTAKQLFSSPGAAPAAGLRYRLIQKRADGTEVDVDSATTFHSGDQVKLSFESNIAGYLYVAAQGSSGSWSVLFPSPEINGGRNQIAPLQEYDVPSDDGWWKFDEKVGTETLFVFLSREPLSQLPGFTRPVNKAETLTASVVQELQQSVRSRDLVFQKDQASGGKPGVKQATYVVNRADVGKAVTATISLIHQ